MATKKDLTGWVLEALRDLGGRGTVLQVSRWIHEHKMNELEQSGDLLYRWQYDIRWAAQELRNEGMLIAAHGKKSAPWEIASGRPLAARRVAGSSTQPATGSS